MRQQRTQCLMDDPTVKQYILLSPAAILPTGVEPFDNLCGAAGK